MSHWTRFLATKEKIECFKRSIVTIKLSILILKKFKNYVVQKIVYVGKYCVKNKIKHTICFIQMIDISWSRFWHFIKNLDNCFYYFTYQQAKYTLSTVNDENYYCFSFFSENCNRYTLSNVISKTRSKNWVICLNHISIYFLLHNVKSNLEKCTTNKPTRPTLSVNS